MRYGPRSSLLFYVAVALFLSRSAVNVLQGCPVTPGLLGQYYDYGNSTPVWDDSLTPIGTRDDLQSGVFLFDVDYAWGPWGTLQDQFGVRWTGYINIPETGEYDFSMKSDDRSWMFIDVDADSTLESAPANAAWTVDWNNVSLAAGLHRVEFRAREFSLREWSRLQWILPGGSTYETIPASYFSRGTCVPEPTTLALLSVAGLFSVAGHTWRKRKRAA